jgi:hypothetical protein
MDYELRTIPGCSNSRPALELFRRVLAAEGADERNPRTVELTSESEAEELDFHGSPSFIADGRYLFTSTASPALTCRVYSRKLVLLAFRPWRIYVQPYVPGPLRTEYQAEPSKLSTSRRYWSRHTNRCCPEMSWESPPATLWSRQGKELISYSVRPDPR